MRERQELSHGLSPGGENLQGKIDPAQQGRGVTQDRDDGVAPLEEENESRGQDADGQMGQEGQNQEGRGGRQIGRAQGHPEEQEAKAQVEQNFQ